MILQIPYLVNDGSSLHTNLNPISPFEIYFVKEVVYEKVKSQVPSICTLKYVKEFSHLYNITQFGLLSQISYRYFFSITREFVQSTYECCNENITTWSVARILIRTAKLGDIVIVQPRVVMTFFFISTLRHHATSALPRCQLRNRR